MIAFVTGTDTDIGKTFITAHLLSYMHKDFSLKTLGLKPIITGVDKRNSDFVHSDTMRLNTASSIRLSVEETSPIQLALPVSPHIAIAKSCYHFNEVDLSNILPEKAIVSSDICLIEGAGGWRVPITPTLLYSEWVKKYQFSVILVVGMKLGCLNHAILTVDAMLMDKVKIVGWIANHVDPDMLCYKENISTLRSLLPIPFLGEVPFMHQSTDKQFYFSKIIQCLLSEVEALSSYIL